MKNWCRVEQYPRAMVLSHVPSAECTAEGSSEVSGLRHCSAHLVYHSEEKPGRTESVLVRVSSAVINIMITMSNGEERVYLAHMSTLLFITEGS